MAALSGSPPARRLALVEEAFRTLPERYLGAEPGFDATYHIRLGDVGPHLGGPLHRPTARACAAASPAASPTSRSAPTPTPGCACARGELSGIEAFSQRRLYARGDLDLAVGFEGLFRLPDGRPPLLRIHDVRVPGRRVSTLTMGEGPDVLLLHGLGGTKASFFDTAAALSRTATGSTRSTSPASAPRASRRSPPTTRASSPTRCSA